MEADTWMPRRGAFAAGCVVAAAGHALIAFTGTLTIVGGSFLVIGAGLVLGACAAFLPARAGGGWLLVTGFAVATGGSLLLPIRSVVTGPGGPFFVGNLLATSGYAWTTWLAASSVRRDAAGSRAPVLAPGLALVVGASAWYFLAALWTYRYGFLPGQTAIGAGMLAATVASRRP